MTEGDDFEFVNNHYLRLYKYARKLIYFLLFIQQLMEGGLLDTLKSAVILSFR